MGHNKTACNALPFVRAPNVHCHQHQCDDRHHHYHHHHSALGLNCPIHNNLKQTKTDGKNTNTNKQTNKHISRSAQAQYIIIVYTHTHAESETCVSLRVQSKDEHHVEYLQCDYKYVYNGNFKFECNYCKHVQHRTKRISCMFRVLVCVCYFPAE